MELFSFPNLVLMPFFDMICLASASAHQDAASSSTVGTTDTYTTSIGPTSTSTPWYLEADGSLRATTYVIIVAVVVVVVALSITCCCCCCSRRGKSTEPPIPLGDNVRPTPEQNNPFDDSQYISPDLTCRLSEHDLPPKYSV
jgi:hypothetical protein